MNGAVASGHDKSITQVRYLEPDWPAPASVRAASSLRGGGVSQRPYAGLNLALHVGDEPEAVARNRRALGAALAWPAEPMWLNQVHGARVVQASPQATSPEADAVYARQAGQVCAVLTADCLPVLFCDLDGKCVAAAHAGWRGLAGGVLGATWAAMGVPAARTMAWLGPAIEPAAFEVGAEVRQAFLARDAAHSAAFARNARGRWQADLHALARRELQRLGVEAIFADAHERGTQPAGSAQPGSGPRPDPAEDPGQGRGAGSKELQTRGGFRCHGERTRFFSYRRDGRTGRMASLIWLQN